MPIRLLAISLLILLGCPSLVGQESLLGSERTLYSKEMAGEIILHNEGWGLGFEHGKYLTAKKRRLLTVQIVGMKHPKEIKSFNPFYEDSRGYFFGKLNSLLILRAGMGKKIQLTEKRRKSGVEVNYLWNIGPSLALLKPVYLQIGYLDDPDNANATRGFPYSYIVDERYDPDVHFPDNIFGRSNWFKGLGELAVRPGIFARFGFNFEYDSENAGLRAIEAGITVDAYPEKLPIMAFDDSPLNSQDPPLNDTVNKRIFAGFYFSAQLGTKFTR